MMFKATWKTKILLIMTLFRSYFLYYAHNLLRSHNLQVLMPLQGLFFYIESLQGSFIQCMPLQELLVHHMSLLGHFVLYLSL